MYPGEFAMFVLIGLGIGIKVLLAGTAVSIVNLVLALIFG